MEDIYFSSEWVLAVKMFFMEVSVVFYATLPVVQQHYDNITARNIVL